MSHVSIRAVIRGRFPWCAVFSHINNHFWSNILSSNPCKSMTEYHGAKKLHYSSPVTGTRDRLWRSLLESCNIVTKTCTCDLVFSIYFTSDTQRLNGSEVDQAIVIVPLPFPSTVGAATTAQIVPQTYWRRTKNHHGTVSSPALRFIFSPGVGCTQISFYYSSVFTRTSTRSLSLDVFRTSHFIFTQRLVH